jgi:hypothetical protein
MDNLLQAIAREEGFFVVGTRPQRNNNPGDIEWHARGIASAYGATHGDPRFAVFPTAEQGFAAMKALLEAPLYRGLTVAQALDKWAPPVENNTNAYTANVCKWVGCTPETPIEGLLACISTLNI